MNQFNSINENIEKQADRLSEICAENSVDYDAVKIMLDAVKLKKLYKRNNYLQEKINETVEKAMK